MKSGLCSKLLSYLVIMLTLSTFAVPTLFADAMPAPAPAQDAPKCWAMDIVLLVDQSLSMGDNDKEDYRYFAVQHILNRLVANRLLECPLAVHRLGLITFGTDAKVFLPMVEINLTDRDDRDKWAQAYVQKIDEARRSSKMGTTDFLGPFEEARKLVEKTPYTNQEPAGYGARHQVLILLTDGDPAYLNFGRHANLSPQSADCRAFRPNRADNLDPQWIQQHMCVMLEEEKKQPVWTNFSIWVVAMHDIGGEYLNYPGFNGSIRSNWEQVVQPPGKLVDLPVNEQNILKALDDIVNKEFGLPGTVLACGKNFTVAPYLDKVTFRFFRQFSDKDKLVTISKLDGDGPNVLYNVRNGKITNGTATAPDYGSTDIDERYTFEQPKSGQWRFNVQGLTDDECERRIIASQVPGFAELSFQPSVVPVMDVSPYYDADQPVYYDVQLRTRAGQPIVQEAQFPVVISVTTTAPDGKPLQVLRLEEQKGKWVSKEPILSPQAGEYVVHIEGKVQGYSGPEENILKINETRRFIAAKIPRLSFNVETPAVNSTLACNTVDSAARKLISNPIAVRVRILDIQQQPIDLRTLGISDLNRVFGAVLRDAGGNTVGTPITLTVGNQGIGIFEGTLLQTQTTPVGCGDVTIDFSFLSDNKDTFIVAKKVRSVAFKRFPSDGVFVESIAPVTSTVLTIHSPATDAMFTGSQTVLPVTLRFRATDLVNKPIKDLAAIANGDVTSLYRVRLISPNPKDFENLSIKLVQESSGSVFEATGGLTLTTPGKYFFEITPQVNSFKAGFVADEQIVSVPFERGDNAPTSTETANLLKWGSWGTLLLIAVIILWLITGGPGGTLELVGLDNSNIAGPWRLSRMRLLSWIPLRRPNLSSNGIRSIRYSKSKPAHPGAKRAVRIKAFQLDGQLLADTIIDKEDSFQISDFNINYK